MAFDNIYVKGASGVILQAMLRNASTGMGQTGLVASGVTAAYCRNNGSSITIGLVSGTVGDVWASGKFAEVSSGTLPGLYQFHAPDACFVTGANSVEFGLKAPSILDKSLKIVLVDVNFRDSVYEGLSSLQTIQNTVIMNSGNIVTYGNITSTISGNLNITNNTINTISGNQLTNYNTLITVSGNQSLTNTTVNTISGNLLIVNNTLNTVSGNIATVPATLISVSGNLNTVNNTVNTISGNLLTNQNNLSTVSGNLNTVNNTLNTVSGNVALLPTITTIVASGNAQAWNAGIYISGVLNTVSGNINTTNNTINTISGIVNNDYNAVTTVSGLVNNLPTITTIVASGNAANWNSVTSTAGLSGQIVTLQNNLTTISGNLNSTSGDVNTLRTNFATISGNLTAVSGAIVIRDLNLCQAGAAGTVTLDTNASAVDNAYQGYTIVLASGTGAGQTRYINSYVGSTKVATISPNWATNPAVTTMYRIVQTNSNIAGNTTGAVTLVTTTTTATTATTATNLTNWPATAIPATATAPIANAVGLSGNAQGWNAGVWISGNLPGVIVTSGNAAGWRAGYEEGSVWIDTVGGAAGTVLYVNGIISNPSNTISNAQTIAAALKTSKLRASNTSVIVAGASLANYELSGDNYALDLGGQAITNSSIHGALLSGISTGQGANIYVSQIGNTTLDSCWIYDSPFTGTITLLASGNYLFKDCTDGIPGDPSPTIVMASGVLLGLRGYRGGINISGMVSGCNLAVDGDCRVIIGSNCTGGDVRYRGFIGVTDNVVGGFSGTIIQTERYNIPYLASNIVTSGNAAGWNNATQILGISGQLVGMSGQIINVDNDLVYVSGLINTLQNNLITVSGNVSNLPTIGIIVASGNAANWNSVTSVDLSGISGSLNTISGNLLTVNNTLNTVSGNVSLLPNITTIVNSGNAAGWNSVTAITTVTVSGYTPGALSQIVSSGNAANWNADTNPVTVSGFTPASLSQVVASGHADGWANVTPVTDLSGISGSLNTISGNVTTIQNNLSTVSGIVNTLPTITSIISSGNANNWNDITNLSGISGSLATISGNLLRTENTLITVSGKVNALPTTDVSVDVTSIKNTVNSVTYGNNALLTAVQNVQNNTFIAATIPALLERPDAGSVVISITVVFSDETGTAKDLDSGNPITTLVNDLGADLSSRLGVWSHPAVGKYTVPYTNTSTDTLEGLHWEVTGTINGKLRRYPGYTQLVDTTAVDFTSADRTMLTQVQNNLITVSGVVRTTDNTLNTVSGNVFNLPLISTIVNSGTAAGWNSIVSSVTVSGITPSVLSQIVSSGHADGWAIVTPATDLSGVSGQLNSISGIVAELPTITTIVASGNAVHWNDITDLAGISGQLINISGNINTLSGQIDLNNSIILAVSGEVSTLQSTLTTVSGNLNTGIQVSGITPEALSQIVASGHADGWNTVTTVTTVTVSGITPSALSSIIASGNQAGWDGNLSIPELVADPGSTPTANQAAMLHYMDIRNKKVQGDPTLPNQYYSIHKDDDSVLASGKVEDINISGIFIKGKLNF